MSVGRRIYYEGATAEDLGITQIEFKSRWITLKEFEQVWDRSIDFEEAYLSFVMSKHEVSGGDRVVSEQNRTKCCTEKEPDLTYGKMFSDLASSIKAIAKSGKKLVDNETHAARYGTCLDCEYLVKRRCKKCGCFMKIKTKFTATKCPIDKW